MRQEQSPQMQPCAYSGGMSDSTVPERSRLERIFAAMAAGVIGASLLSMAATLVAVGIFHVDGVVWSILAAIPLIGLPIGILLILAVVLIGFIQRRKARRRP